MLLGKQLKLRGTNGTSGTPQWVKDYRRSTIKIKGGTGGTIRIHQTRLSR